MTYFSTLFPAVSKVLISARGHYPGSSDCGPPLGPPFRFIRFLLLMQIKFFLTLTLSIDQSSIYVTHIFFFIYCSTVIQAKRISGVAGCLSSLGEREMYLIDVQK